MLRLAASAARVFFRVDVYKRQDEAQLGGRNQVNGEMVFQQFNVGVKLGRLQKFGGNFQSGCVFGVEDAPFGVAALPGQFIILSLVAGVKVHSPFQQFPDSVRAFLHDSCLLYTSRCV